MTTKHTPGPWTAHIYRAGTAVIKTSDCAEVATVQYASADARLIAAAPDLLEACEALVSGLKNDAFDLARAAIAKAKRRQVEWRQRGRGDEGEAVTKHTPAQKRSDR